MSDIIRASRVGSKHTSSNLVGKHRVASLAYFVVGVFGVFVKNQDTSSSAKEYTARSNRTL